LISVIAIYASNQNFKLNNEETYSIYGVLIISLLISQLFGSVIGDLVLGNKKALIIGGVIQGIGALIISTLSIEGFYIGLVLFVIGNGLYSQNMVSHFGKNYLNKYKYLDSAYLLYQIHLVSSVKIRIFEGCHINQK